VQTLALGAFVITNATWAPVPAVVPADSAYSLTAAVALVQSLTAEGSSGIVVVYANFSDGRWAEITPAEGAVVQVAEQFRHDLFMSRSGPDGAQLSVSVAPSALPVSAANVIQADWIDSCTGAGIVSGAGAVTIQMAAPLSAIIVIEVRPAEVEPLWHSSALISCDELGLILYPPAFSLLLRDKATAQLHIRKSDGTFAFLFSPRSTRKSPDPMTRPPSSPSPSPPPASSPSSSTSLAAAALTSRPIRA
jgi:hypothetical protein